MTRFVCSISRIGIINSQALASKNITQQKGTLFMLFFKFTPTKDDYIKAFRTFYLSSWPVWGVLIVFLLSQIIFFGLAFIRGDLGFDLGGILPIVLIVFIASYLAFTLVINPMTAASKLEKNERLSSPVQYEVNDEQIMFKNQFAETKLDWGSFQKVIESKDIFLLVYTTNKNMFQIIPKRAFASTDDEQAFKNLLNTKIPQNKKINFNIKNPAVIVTVVITTGFCLFFCAIAALSFVYKAFLSK
jgi:hypothetical protein